jgi:hypothetical protein
MALEVAVRRGSFTTAVATATATATATAIWKKIRC